MPEGNALEIEKFNLLNKEQLSFMKEHIRGFYDARILSWQYDTSENSAGGLFFSKNGDAYIASQGMIPISLLVAGKAVLTAKSESSFLLEAYRGKGIFEALYQQAILFSEKDGVELIWGFTALTKVWRDKLGFEVHEGIVVEATLQLGLRSALASALKTPGSVSVILKQLLKALYGKVKTSKSGRGQHHYTACLLDFRQLPDQKQVLEVYDVWQKSHEDLISVAPGKAYFDWRLNTNPVISYQYIGIFDQSRPVAVGIINDSAKNAYLVDFVVTDDRLMADSLDALIGLVKSMKRFSHLTYWANSKNAYNKRLLDFFSSKGAFMNKNGHMNLVVKNTQRSTLSVELLKDVSKFCLNGLWTEGFRI